MKTPAQTCVFENLSKKPRTFSDLAYFKVSKWPVKTT